GDASQDGGPLPHGPEPHRGGAVRGLPDCALDRAPGIRDGRRGPDDLGLDRGGDRRGQRLAGRRARRDPGRLGPGGRERERRSRGTRARTVGLYHMVLNLIVVGLFVVSLIARWTAPLGYGTAGVGRMIWGWIGVAIAVVSAWLGGELVETLGVSVREGANVNADLGGREPGRWASTTWS